MESYQRLFDVIYLQNLQMLAEHWMMTELLVRSTLVQLVLVAVTLVLAALLARPLRARLRESLQAPSNLPNRLFLRALLVVATPLIALPLLVVLVLGARLVGQPGTILVMALQVVVTWIALRELSKVIRSDFWSRIAFWVAFLLAAAWLLGFLETIIINLDRIGFNIGTLHLSVLDLLWGIAQLALLIWVALLLAHLGDNYVQNAKGVAPSLRVLTAKLLRLGLVAIALVVALASVGIDITAFALVTGALGVALGFGMQKTVSNLISGLLLLMDRSIKPGDVLELSDPSDRTVQLFGWVTALNARYVSLTTRDGTEWLVPNEELISTRIVNWSYSHNRMRLLTPIAVSFDSDVEMAMDIAVNAALETPRVLSDPPPVCRLMSFGDSCVNLELRFWIEDPTNGIINVRSDVLLATWARFRKHGIRTRLGHRDLFIKGGSELTIRQQGAGDAPAA